jgi:RimJ/RimL family protein N-acetyltransferase
MKYSGQRYGTHTIQSQWHYMTGFDQVTRHYLEIARQGISGYCRPIGTITAYRDIQNKTANMGLLIRRRSWGNGYGLEAWLAVMDWLFRDGIRKVEAGCYSRNIGMMQVFVKSGMSVEGVRKSSVQLDDGWCDLIEVGRFNHGLSAKHGPASVGQQTGHQRDSRLDGQAGTRSRAAVASSA